MTLIASIPQDPIISFPITLIFLLVLPLIFLLSKRLKSSLFLSPPLPPGPFAWPIVGNLLQFGSNPHQTLAHFAQKHGPLFSLKLGTQLVVVGSSPAAASEILKTHDRNLSARYVPHNAPAKDPKLNNLSLGWVLECNDNWRHLRSVCRTELFSGKAINSQAPKRDDKVAEMLGFVAKMEGKVLQIREVAFAVIFNMMSNILVSKDLAHLEDESLNGGICGHVRTIMEVAAAPNVSDFYPFLGPLDLQNLRKRAMGLYDEIWKMWEEIVEERRSDNKYSTRDHVDHSCQQHDFLDALLRNGFANDQINILLVELLTAGTDTSSSTVEWTMTELVKNPKYMKIVQEELGREVGRDNMVREAHLPKLTFLQACLKETLRLHPAGPILLPHRAAETCQVMNYTIPKNTEVLVNFWAIGRDPEYWEDPLEFKPERFLNSSLDFRGNDFEFIPFGSGRRICPGMPMAAKHVPLVTAALVHAFDWSLPDGVDAKDLDMAEKFGIAMRKEEPLLVVPKSKFKEIISH